MKKEEEISTLSLTDTFEFSCGKDNTCFNECCANLNQFLTPYDLIRLKNRLGIRSYEFLEKYGDEYIGPQTGLPIVSLKPDYKNRLRCPFVSEQGCKVYDDRPSSCRLYPLMRLASRDRESGNITAYYALLREEHCKGFENGKRYTVYEWLKDQKAEEYNRINDIMIEIIGIANMMGAASFDSYTKDMFRMICYDSDSFRNYIFEKKRSKIKVDENIADIIREDDTELLKFGLGILKKNFFDKV